MQIILSNLVKKKIEIVLTAYKSLVSGKDLRDQLYLAGIDLDVPEQGDIKGYGDVYYKNSAIRYIFDNLNNEQVLNYISKIYTNVIVKESSHESFLEDINEKLQQDSIRINEDGSITQGNTETSETHIKENKDEQWYDKTMLTRSFPHELKSPSEKTVLKDKDRIFIVHGHDEGMKESVARVIEKLELKPIILHDQANMGKTIIEKFEKHSENVACAVVLLSPDDMGYKVGQLPELAKLRARQNVVLELGYFIGRLGREKVFVLVKNPNELEMPSDILAFVYIEYGNGWQMQLGKEIKECGLDIDMNKLI